jgi:acetyl-CoA synthetase
MSQQHDTIEALYGENRKFPPPADFAARANVQDDALYRQGEDDYVAFWEEQARALDWFEPWHTALEWDAPYARWFIGGKLNASYNCLDRHVLAGRGDKVA